MRTFAKAISILLSLVAVMGITLYTLDRNLQAGVYPSDADSIAIPLFETVISLMVILVPLTLAFLLTSFKFSRKRIQLFIGAFLYIGGAGLAALLALSWFTPQHYGICAAYAFLAAVALALAVLALRKPPSNPAVKRDAGGAP